MLAPSHPSPAHVFKPSAVHQYASHHVVQPISAQRDNCCPAHRCGLANFCPDGSAAPTPCPAGRHGDPALRNMASASECPVCQPGTWCAVGSLNATNCAPGRYSANVGKERCDWCPAGRYQKEEGATSCETCATGHYCTLGASTSLPCPGGTHMNFMLEMRTSVSDCIVCANGTFCPVGSVNETLCAAGTHNGNEGQVRCSKCEAGKYQDTEGATGCKLCESGCYCEEGAAAALPCPANFRTIKASLP